MRIEKFMAALLSLSAGALDLHAQGRYAEVGKRASRAVVKIESFDANKKGIGAGSGFLATSNGVVVTNYHVIEDAAFVTVRTAAGSLFPVIGVIQFDAKKDFAFLKVDGVDLPSSLLGNSDQVEIGEEILAIGHPRGLDYTMSNGIVSQRRQLDGYAMLQITAPISPGSSGGPVLNLKGQIVAIVTSYREGGQNLNFALPVNYIRTAMEAGLQAKYTLKDVAGWQAKQDARRLADKFLGYDGKYNTYRAIYLREWEVKSAEFWNKDNTSFTVSTVFAPKSAQWSEPGGYLSEGVRVDIRLPSRGKEWSVKTSAELAPLLANEMAAANSGFVKTALKPSTLGAQPVHQFEAVGQGEKISEPEKTRFYVLARAECRLVVEMAAPASKFKSYEPVFDLFAKALEFKACPDWK